jgi:hypothetical protein
MRYIFLKVVFFTDFAFGRNHLQNLDLLNDDAPIYSFFGLLAGWALN